MYCFSKLSGVQEVLTMMNSLKINISVETYTATARIYAWNKNNAMLLEELKKAQNNGIKFEENHIMEIIKTLADVVNYEPVPKVSGTS